MTPPPTLSETLDLAQNALVFDLIVSQQEQDFTDHFSDVGVFIDKRQKELLMCLPPVGRYDAEVEARLDVNGGTA